MEPTIKHGLCYISKATDWIKDHDLAIDFTDTIACKIPVEKSRYLDCVIDAYLWTVLESWRPSSWHHHMLSFFLIQSSSLRIASPPHIVLLMGQGMAVNTGVMLGSYRRNIPLDKKQENCSLRIMRPRVRKHCWWLMHWNQVDLIPTGTHVLRAEINRG